MKKFLSIGALSALLLSAPAYASFNFSGTSTDGNPISGTADFTIGAGTITIILENTSSTIHGIAEVLYGVKFDLNGTGVHLNTNPTSITGTNAPSTTNDGYTCTANCEAADITPVTTSWKTNTPSGNPASSFYLTTLPGAGNQYGIANDNIIHPTTDGLATDSPYIRGPVTFVVPFTATVNPTSVSNVAFYFGTSGTPSTVPEPGFYGVLSLGVAGIMFARRRKKIA